MDNKHRYSQYIGWGITAFAVIAAGVLFYFSIDYMGDLVKAIRSLMGILSPFIWGLVISYLLVPSMMMYERKLFRPLVAYIKKRRPKVKLSKKLPRVLALILAEIVMLLLITALIYLIVPQVYDSISAIITNSPAYFESASKAIDNLLHDFPEIEMYATKVFGNITETLTKWATNTLLPSMENIVTNITTGVFSVVKAVYNIAIGMIVSIYILYNKEPFIAHYRKTLYCLFKPEKARKISSALRFADRTFMGFIVGKLLDSAIIGMICYVGCVVMRMPYDLLISVIIGVTNIIPFFGPFIGAIPSAFIIFIAEPKMTLWFILMIFVIQQLDGNVIGPKILGDSTGLSALGVLVSITIAGGFFGFAGMILGVPAAAVICALVHQKTDARLRAKKAETELEYYMTDPPERDFEKEPIFIEKPQSEQTDIQGQDKNGTT